MKKGLILAGTAFMLLATGCATQGSASDYGTNAACCATPAPCNTCVSSCPSCKGLSSCKAAYDADADAGTTTVKSKKIYRKKVSHIHG